MKQQRERHEQRDQADAVAETVDADHDGAKLQPRPLEPMLLRRCRTYREIGGVHTAGVVHPGFIELLVEKPAAVRLALVADCVCKQTRVLKKSSH